MSENQAAVQENSAAEAPTFKYPVRVEDAGPGAKKVTVEIPAERIGEKLGEQFKKLRQTVALPGFRPGHAPQKLVEKRFANEVREDVRRELISESYEQAISEQKLEVLGEPVFEKVEDMKLPEQGPMSYSFEVEVQPPFTLPELKGIAVKKPKITVTDEHVEKAMSNLRRQQGTLVPVEDRGVEKDDLLTADVRISLDSQVVFERKDMNIQPTVDFVAGVKFEKLAEQLAGLKAGESRILSGKASAAHPTESIRDKDVQVEVALKDIKRLEEAEITPEFISELGFENEQQLRDALREQLVERIDADIQRNMADQVRKYFLDQVTLEIPAKLSKRQEERVVQRRALDLLRRGMSYQQVEANIEQIRTGAGDEAARELKLAFILQKVAAELNVDVDEAELNGAIAEMAAGESRRPEKLKQEMAKDGRLMNLYMSIREQKAIERILADAKIEETDAPAAS